MILEDFIYFTSLGMCIGVGKHYKYIEDVQMKKCYGAGMGLLVVFLICRQHFFHTFFMVLGNIVIIKCSDKRYIHQLSLAFTWVYLLYLNYNLDVSRYVTFIHQGLALKLVGLAFELRILPEKSKINIAKPPTTSQVDLKVPSQQQIVTNEDDPSALDILTYSYFFVGIHKGPYYRLNIFYDYFDLPISTLSDCRAVTKEKLWNVAICMLGYVLLSIKFPLQTYGSEDFYKNCSSDYRFFYNVPQVVIFCLHHQVIMTLCTCVFTETGFGVYSSRRTSIPAIGRSKRSSVKLSEIKPPENIPSTVNIQEQELNFTLLKCFDNEKLLEGPMMKTSMRGWDIPTQYWFWTYIYKSLLKANKEVRSACSFFIWSVWMGPTFAHVVFSVTIWIYIHLENEYDTVYNTTYTMRYAWNFGYSVSRLVFLIYLMPCLILDDAATVFKYYTSLYWLFHVILILLVISGLVKFWGVARNEPVNN